MNYFNKNEPLNTFLGAAKSVLTAPKSFFAEMPVAAFYSNSIFYASFLIFLASFIGLPFLSFTVLFLLPVSWGVGLILIRLWAGYFAMVGKFGSANAYQLVAYAMTPLLLAGIPYVNIAAILYALYLLCVGLAERTQRSMASVTIMVALPASVTASVGYAAWVVVSAISFGGDASAGAPAY